MESNEYNLIWIDLEMTGLDTQSDAILEIAVAITNADLSEVVKGPEIVIHQPDSVLSAMNEWNTKQHTQSGLVDAVKTSKETYETASKQTIKFLRKYVDKGRSPMCGNTICQDRRFLARLMPEVENYFHYRHLDVSTIKELARRWYPEFYKARVKPATHSDNDSDDNGGGDKTGGSRHRAMSDILDSIEELRLYQSHLFVKDDPR